MQIPGSVPSPQNQRLPIGSQGFPTNQNIVQYPAPQNIQSTPTGNYSPTLSTSPQANLNPNIIKQN